MTSYYDIRFNQDGSCFSSVAASHYTICTTQPYNRCLTVNKVGIGRVYMLYVSSLICIVGNGLDPSLSPRKLLLYNTKTHSTICELNFKSTVVNVQLNNSRLVVVLENKVHLFDLRSLKLLHSIDTVDNPLGVIALSSGNSNRSLALGSNSSSSHSLSAERSYAAYPISNERGDLTLYDTHALHVTQQIKAHKQPLRLVCFNNDSTLLATCSTQGTVIRVWSVPSGIKLFTFRRGTVGAQMTHMQFNTDSTYLAVSSQDSHTIHVFSLKPDHDKHYSAQTATDSVTTTATNLGVAVRDAVSATLSKSPLTASIPATASTITTKVSDTASSAYNMLPTALTRNIHAAGTTITNAISQQYSSVSHSIPVPALPASLQDVVDPARNFASITLKAETYVAALAFSDITTMNVCTTAGQLCSYEVLHTGGVCKLLSEHSLSETANEMLGVRLSSGSHEEESSMARSVYAPSSRFAYGAQPDFSHISSSTHTATDDAPSQPQASSQQSFNVLHTLQAAQQTPQASQSPDAPHTATSASSHNFISPSAAVSFQSNPSPPPPMQPIYAAGQSQLTLTSSIDLLALDQLTDQLAQLDANSPPPDSADGRASAALSPHSTRTPSSQSSALDDSELLQHQADDDHQTGIGANSATDVTRSASDAVNTPLPASGHLQ